LFRIKVFLYKPVSVQINNSKDQIMKRLLFFMLIILPFTACKKRPESSGGMIKADIFLNPPAEFRSAPFYALNDKLDTTELIRQIHSFKNAGYGGFFLHSRTGLLTEYMGNEWWKAMDAAVRTAEQTGLKAWFYDEDKWPSGFAGGKVPLMSEEFHSRYLSRVDKKKKLGKTDQVIFEDDKFRYICHKSEMGNAWFNGTTYVDLLNPDMVKAFIDSAYAPYLERYKNEMGKTAPGIFTDEPQVSPRVSGSTGGSVSFSPAIVDRFREMHGYDILPKIPSLFDTTGNFRKIRYDYYQTISHCFEESFTKQIGEFNSKYNSIFTGHINGEETLSSVMINVGNAMITYRHMQMPGIDHLGLAFGSLNSPRSVSSVANQYGISRRLCEAYGISGQNMNFEDRKWLLDWLTINGINFIVPHLSLYSMKGERKRDYPPDFSPAQPYWEYNKLFEDYTGRMCYVNTLGKYAADIVVIHPLESEYLGIKNNCYQQYDNCLNALQLNHRNFDLGDEQIIADIAKAENKKFIIGQMSYKVVILPGMIVIRRSTLSLLKQFKASGGTILVYGRYPDYINGELLPEAIDSLKQISRLVEENEFLKALNIALPSVYNIEGLNNELIWSHYRLVEKGGILQLSNTSRLKEVECNLSFSHSVKNLVLWNPEDGSSMKLAPGSDGRIKLHFAAVKSYIITFGDASKDAIVTNFYKVPAATKEIAKIEGPWQGQRLDPNAITLDFARYSTDNGRTYSNPEPVIGIHQRLQNKKYTGKLILKFEPEVTDIPLKCSLVAEQPQLYNISVNDKKIKFTGKDYYIDHTFSTQDISGTLKQGVNEILLSLDYVAPEPASLNAYKRYGTEIESVYLIGDFAISVTPSAKPLMESQKNSLKLFVSKPVHSISHFAIDKEISEFDDDLIMQGYPFYSGSFVLSKTFMFEKKSRQKKYYISFPSFEAIVIKVKINEKEFDPLIYSPWETEISEALKEGENRVEITLINSLRNLLGPHHHSGGELTGVGPASFTGNSGWPNTGGENDWYDLRLKGTQTLWMDDYFLIPFGLLEPPVISETD
jgi:hypothetical protein